MVRNLKTRPKLPKLKPIDLVYAVAFIAVLAVYVYLAYSVASLPGTDGLPNGPGYISDEVWYVTSARNLLHDVFKTPASSPYFTTTKECAANTTATVVKAYRELSNVVTVEGVVPCYLRRGFPYPDKGGILEYYNFEHPPLTKYIIAAAQTVRDEPIYWRIPSIVLGAGTLLLVFLTARKLAGNLWALVATAAMLFDGTFRAMSGIAMPDIYLGFFTALLVYSYVVLRSGLATSIALGLAASVKYSGAFPIFGLTYLYARKPLWKFLLLLTVAGFIFVLIYSPIIAKMGLSEWMKTLFNSFMWHTTSRPEGPIASTPLDWLFMRNSFVLHVNPHVYASGTLVYLLALIYALYKRDEVSTLYISTYGGYWIVYALGNHTLYSFYTAHFSPIAHILLAQLLASAVKARKEGVKRWLEKIQRLDTYLK